MFVFVFSSSGFLLWPFHLIHLVKKVCLSSFNVFVCVIQDYILKKKTILYLLIRLKSIDVLSICFVRIVISYKDWNICFLILVFNFNFGWLNSQLIFIKLIISSKICFSGLKSGPFFKILVKTYTINLNKHLDLPDKLWNCI